MKLVLKELLIQEMLEHDGEIRIEPMTNNRLRVTLYGRVAGRDWANTEPRNKLQPIRELTTLNLVNLPSPKGA